MGHKINYVLKVLDAGMPTVRKALQQAGITVESIVQVHKEEVPDKPDKEEKQVQTTKPVS